MMDVGGVDRRSSCPLLVRMFLRVGGHNSAAAYAPSTESRSREGPSPQSSVELQTYTWPDATLRELADIIKEEKPEWRKPRCELSFAIVYPDRQGTNVLKEVGRVRNRDIRPLATELKTLQSLRFQTGDYLDVAVYGAEEAGQSGS